MVCVCELLTFLSFLYYYLSFLFSPFLISFSSLLIAYAFFSFSPFLLIFHLSLHTLFPLVFLYSVFFSSIFSNLYFISLCLSPFLFSFSSVLFLSLSFLFSIFSIPFLSLSCSITLSFSFRNPLSKSSPSCHNWLPCGTLVHELHRDQKWVNSKRSANGNLSCPPGWAIPAVGIPLWTFTADW